ncbi:VanZ family protein [Pseudoflavonifractor sp. MSJ-37]|uniref:VanZ family protein n=1 Tax=Pseudoflavonifractor sp. MSJ-37 TaxID=2841531 RepID=UPI0020A0023F|nr:VanZ family protein [Pseudoflavonifractor sp. MSJ-37]
MIMGSGTMLGHFLQALPIACAAGLLYAVVRIAGQKRRNARIGWKRELLRALFVCYLTGLISLVVLPANFWLRIYDGLFLGWWDELGPILQIGDVELVPSIIKHLDGTRSIGSWARTMLAGNVILFLPLGLFLPIVTGRRGWRTVLSAAVLAPVCLETLQLFFGRSFDIDDLICNFIGIALGGAIASAVLAAGGNER